MKKLFVFTLLVLAMVLVPAGAVLGSPPADKPGNGPPELDKVVFIHYDKGVKPDHPVKPVKPPKSDEDENPVDQYKLSQLILPGTMDYFINPPSIAGAVEAISASVDAWEDAAGQNLFNYVDTTLASGAVLDYQNTVSWAPITDPNVIAHAVMWYTPGKPPRAIREFDIVFNSQLPWAVGSDNAYDIQNIATHEVGHPVGLADIYEPDCNMLTMYGYSGIGETQKRTLESGDILGAQALYGAP